MSDPKQRYFIAEQGRTLKEYFRIINPADNTVYDLEAEGYTESYLQVRDATYSDGGVLLLDLSVANGGVSIEYIADDGNGQEWSGYVYASATDMDTPLWGDAVYEHTFYHSGGDHSVMSRGPAMLVPKVVN